MSAFRSTLVFGVLCTALFGCGEDDGGQPAAGDMQVMSARPGGSTPAGGDAPGATSAGNGMGNTPADDGATPAMSDMPASGSEQTPDPVLNPDGPQSLGEPMPPASDAPGKLATESGVIRIMAIGDSITRATCWRAALWDELNQSFPARFDFVGTLSSDNGCAPAGYDRDNQGYSSSLITEIVANVTTARTCDPNPCPALADLQQAFLAQPTDVALLHFGTNDVWNAKNPQDIVNGYSEVVKALRAANPKVVILVAQIIPMNVSDTTCAGCTCAGCATGVPALNALISSWAAQQSSAESPVRVVDQFDDYDAVADNRDGVHPNELGSKKIADRWFAALQPLF
ncbi:MAG TPA: GDSL-type esterase/lipase family protein [Polyangiaceae bacterium]|nr:GDSL-type esterase/lipase family protein [Polyangiaceae bacterium]